MVSDTDIVRSSPISTRWYGNRRSYTTSSRDSLWHTVATVVVTSPRAPKAAMGHCPVKRPMIETMAKKVPPKFIKDWADRAGAQRDSVLAGCKAAYLSMGTETEERISATRCSPLLSLSLAAELRIILWGRTEGAIVLTSSGVTKSRPSMAAHA